MKLEVKKMAGSVNITACISHNGSTPQKDAVIHCLLSLSEEKARELAKKIMELTNDNTK